MKHRWFYPARAERIIDGDTAVLTLDMGLRVFKRESCRLYGIDTPELRGPQPDLAVQAMNWLSGRLMGHSLLAESAELDKYGRPLVILWDFDAPEKTFLKSINQELITNGLAVPA